jgi:hypothetical protein
MSDPEPQSSSHVLLGLTPWGRCQNPNDECRSAKETRMPKAEGTGSSPWRRAGRPEGSSLVPWALGFRNSFGFRHSTFGFGTGPRPKSRLHLRCPARQLVGKDELGERVTIRCPPDIRTHRPDTGRRRRCDAPTKRKLVEPPATSAGSPLSLLVRHSAERDGGRERGRPACRSLGEGRGEGKVTVRSGRVDAILGTLEPWESPPAYS